MNRRDVIKKGIAGVASVGVLAVLGKDNAGAFYEIPTFSNLPDWGFVDERGTHFNFNALAQTRDSKDFLMVAYPYLGEGSKLDYEPEYRLVRFSGRFFYKNSEHDAMQLLTEEWQMFLMRMENKHRHAEFIPYGRRWRENEYMIDQLDRNEGEIVDF